MSDPAPTTPDPVAPAATPDAAAALAVPETPRKRPGLIRRSAVIILLVVVVLGLAAVPFVVEPFVLAKIRSGLAAQNLELAPESRLSLSVFGGSLSGENLVLREIGSTTPVFTATRLSADVAILDSIGQGDAILDEVVLEGMTGELRRNPDGRVPVLEPKGPDGKGWGDIDWIAWGRKLVDHWKSQKEQQDRQTEEARKPPAPDAPKPRPEVKDDQGWKDAKVYVPPPKPKSDGTWPRLLVRRLRVSGSKLGLPDESPLDITRFDLTGTNVTWALRTGEAMHLDGGIDTQGAGPLKLTLDRTHDDDSGKLVLSGDQLPLALLEHPKISGGRFAAWQPKGTAKLNLTAGWKGWGLDALADSTVSGLQLSPPPTAGKESQQVAQVVNSLKGAPIRWPVTFGGTLYAPEITDSGVDDVLKGSAADAAKAMAAEKAKEEAGKLLDKGADKLGPKAGDAGKKVGEGLKGLLGK